ncbi:MAG: lamin tail domain-containing protein [Acidobacteria bacterium]|nr:lamin tail domain-containing protein [Acidobacteriota bacterium]
MITEIMYDPSAVNDTAGEWFEIYNTSGIAVDINGWTIEEADGSPSHTINNGGPLSIGGNTYAVLARDDDSTMNGGVTAVYEYGSWALSNSQDSIVLKNGMTVVDTVEYDENPFPVAVGASIALAGAEGDLATVDNNASANWCLSTTEFGTGSPKDKGTPGAANDCPMPEPPPDPVTGEIFDIQGSGLDSPHIGATATTNDNIVTAVGGGGFFIQTPSSRSDDNVNTSDGIFVVHSGSPTVAVGDQVDVVGTVLDGSGASDQRRTWFFSRIDATVAGGSVTVDASNQPLPAPVELNASLPSPNPRSLSCTSRFELECYEGMRVRVASGTVFSGSQRDRDDTEPVGEMYVTASSSRPFREPGIEYPGLPGLPVWDGNPEVFRLDPDKLGLTNVSWDPGTTFSATGVLAWEFFGNELWPRSNAPASGTGQGVGRDHGRIVEPAEPRGER